MNHEPGRLARRMTRPVTTWILSLVPVLLGIALIAFVPSAERDQQSQDSRPVDAQSTRALELAEELPASEGSVAIVLWTAESSTLDEATLADLEKQSTALLAEAAKSSDGTSPWKTSEAAPPGATPQGTSGTARAGLATADAKSEDGMPARGPLTASADGTAAFTIIPINATSSSQNVDEVMDLRDQLRADAPEGVDVVVTGPAAVQADLGQVFDGANFKLLAATALVVALLLIVTYRSPVLWLVPIVVVGIADRVAAVAATHVLKTFDVAWNESTIGILSVLVFGAGTNYALLLISRYRDELRKTDDRYEAMARAYGPTAEAVFASATTVVLGLLTLLLSVIPTTRGLGLACAVGIVIAAVFVMIALPASLLLFGRKLFWPVVPKVGEALAVDHDRSIWSRVGRTVALRPKTWVVGTVVLLAALAAGLTQVQSGLDTSEQFLETPEAITASERLGESFPAGTSDPITVITREDPAAVISSVREMGGISEARVTNSGEGVTRIDVTALTGPDSPETRQTVEDLREALADYDDTYVGGTTAQSMDEREGATRDRTVLMPLILGLVILALVVILRSVVAPLILVSTVLMTFAAAMGASWWVFTGLLGFDALDSSVPLLAFLFLVALGVDYNIFLITRAREEGRTHGVRAGILRALTSTGGVITSAGILLAAVFAVLGVLPLVVLAQLGVIVFIGVLLDTLLVRTILVPALVLTLGDKFWWPRRSGVAPAEPAVDEAGTATVAAG